MPPLLSKRDKMLWQQIKQFKRSCKLRPKLKRYASKRRKMMKRYVLKKRNKLQLLQPLPSKKRYVLKKRKKS